MTGTLDLQMARALARRHGLLITEQEDDRRPVWVVYRERVRIGKRSSPRALLRLVRNTTTTAR